MFKRGWVIALAIGLTALSGQAQEEQEQTKGAENNKAQANRADPLSVLIEDGSSIVVIHKDSATDAAKRAEEEAEKREIDDLIAQEGMHFHTERMANYAYVQTWLIGVGTALVFVSLGVAIFSNIVAIRAVASAKESSDWTRATAIASTEAFFEFTIFETLESLENISEAMRLHVKIKNTGKGAATSVKGYFAIEFGSRFSGAISWLYPILGMRMMPPFSWSAPVLAVGSDDSQEICFASQEIQFDTTGLFGEPISADFQLHTFIVWTDNFGQERSFWVTHTRQCSLEDKRVTWWEDSRQKSTFAEFETAVEYPAGEG